MRNKQSKSLKKEKSPTANAEVKHLPKEPHSALAVAVAVAALPVVPRRKNLAVAVKRVLARKAVQRRVQAKTIRLQSTGSKSTLNAPSVKSRISKQ
jgi:hypothetical protein